MIDLFELSFGWWKADQVALVVERPMLWFTAAARSAHLPALPWFKKERC